MAIDLFISHASEDKDEVARPIATELRRRGWTVWYDEFELTLGDGLRGSIDRGLAEARFGLVVISPHFFERRWPEWELEGLTARETRGPDKVILPVWHKVDVDYVMRFSPPLANKVAVQSSAGLAAMVDHIERALASPRSKKPRRRVNASTAEARRIAGPPKLHASPEPPPPRNAGKRGPRPTGPPPGTAAVIRRIATILSVTIALTVIVIVVVRTVTV